VIAAVAAVLAGVIVATLSLPSAHADEPVADWNGSSSGRRRGTLDFYSPAYIGDENTRANHLGARTQWLNAFDAGNGRDYTMSMPTARVWAGGFMSARSMRTDGADGFEIGGFVQAGLTPNDIENRVPLYDAFMLVPIDLDDTQNQWLEIRFGQYFTPFGRMRNLAENQYQVIERAPVIEALAPERDLGFEIDYSRRAYLLRVGVFAGEGRNRLVDSGGVMTVARFVYQPFGPVDSRDETTANDTHLHRRVLSLGASVAYNRHTTRAQGTSALDYQLGRPDELHLGADVLYRYRGGSLSAEVIHRRSSLGQRSGVDSDGNPITEYGRHAVGYVLQVSARLPGVEYDAFELVGRWSHLMTYRGTDPVIERLARLEGRQFSYGFDLYFTGDHHLKFQFQTSHSFVRDAPNHSRVLLALDGTFDWHHRAPR